MKAYVISVILVGVIGSFVTILSPEGERGGMVKHTSFAVGLCLVLVCVSPLASFVKGVKDLDANTLIPDIGVEESLEYESIFNSSYDAAEIENLKEGIRSILYERFDVEPSECYVNVTVSEGNTGERQLLRIFINLYGSAIWKDTEEIEKYLSSLFGCEIITAVG